MAAGIVVSAQICRLDNFASGGQTKFFDGKIAALGSPEDLKASYGAADMDEVFRTIVGRAGKEDRK